MKIGVVVVPIPAPAPPETEHVPGYAAFRLLALRAEATGFDSIWLIDHLLLRYPDQSVEEVWEMFSLLGAYRLGQG